MCIIVDANKLGGFLTDSPNPNTEPIHTWLRRGKGVIVYSTGGTFAREIGRGARERLTQYVRAGRAQPVPPERFADDERSLRDRIRSDDAHVLALARASGARLLYTADRDLMDDFRNKRFIDKPRGRVYSGAANARMLAHAACRPRSR